MNELLKLILEQLTAMNKAVSQWPMALRSQDNIPNDVQYSPDFEKRRVMKSIGCRPFDLFCINNGADIWWHIFDQATDPRTNQVPIFTLPVPGGTVGSLPLKGGLHLSNGLAMAASTDATKLVLTGTDQVRFIASLRV